MASVDFKTRQKYQLQAMSITTGVRMLLQQWLRVWRPLFAKDRAADSDPLFVTTKGSPMVAMSRNFGVLWTKIFKKAVSITTIRMWKVIISTVSA